MDWPLGGDIVYGVLCVLLAGLCFDPTDSAEPPPMQTVKDKSVVDPKASE